MILRRAILVAAILTSISTSGSFAQCTMGRYAPDQRSYIAEKLQLPVALNWECVGSKFENNGASPVVAGDRAYFTCGTRVYATDLNTGEMIWKYPTDQGLASTVRCTPAISNGLVYFGCGDGMLYCLDAEMGTFEWAFQTRGALRCPPVIFEGCVYLGSDDNSIYAVNAVTGEAVWKKPFTAKDDIAGGIAIGSGMIIASCMDGNMYGVNASSGKLRWMFRLSGAPVGTSPIISDNTVAMAIGTTVYGLNVRSGQTKWIINLPSEASATPAADGPTIYVPCKNRKIYAYNVAGRQPAMKWLVPADFGAIPLSSPVVAEDTLFVTGSKGVVAAYSVADGSMKWHYMIAPAPSAGVAFTDAASSPTIANGNLLVLTEDGVLHCFASAAPDSELPIVYGQKPVNGTAVPAAPPTRFSAIVYDLGSGVDFSTVSLTLDGQSVEYTTDFATSTISAVYGEATETEGKQAKRLSNGMHKVKLVGKDYAGNSLSDEWFFIADPSIVAPKSAVSTGKTTADPTKPGSSRWTRPPGYTPGTAGSPPSPPMPTMPTMPTRGDRGSRRDHPTE